MSVQYYPNGIGGTAPGDSLDLARPLQTTGNVWYVNSVGGVNAASPAGQNREKPLATVAQAITNALDDDIIVFLPGHTESLAGTTTINKRLTLIGEGTTADKPAVSFRRTTAGTLFGVTALNVEFRNIYFPPAPAAATGRIAVTGVAQCRIRGCYFELGSTDDVSIAVTLSASANQCRIESCTFISIALSGAVQPFAAILAGGAITDLEITNTVVSAGVSGFSNYAAIDLSAAAATRCKFTGISLLLGADINMGASATGYVNVQLATGGSRVAWG